MIITNLFSIFDPSLSLFSLSWFSMFVLFFIFPSFYFSASFFSKVFSWVFNIIFSEVGYVLSSPKKGVYSFIGSIFILLSFYNIMAIFPHLFSLTSHLSVTAPLSFSFWLGIIIFSWVSSFKSFLSHLVPIATPYSLISFIVIVEFLSMLIRPLALTFRLTANMMAGHLILSLIGRALLGLGLFSILLGSFFLFFLTFMELGVCLVQAYVFSSLVLLYISEGN